nr:AI-2E family transporter [Actinomycetota bacterium]
MKHGMDPTQNDDRISAQPDGTRGIPSPLNVVAGYAWRLLVILAAAAVIVYVLVKLRLIVLPVIVALLICTLLAPLVDRLKRRRWKPALATWTVLGSAILILAGLIAVVSPQVAAQIGDMGDAVRDGSDQVLEWLTRGPLELSQEEIQGFIDRIGQRIQENSSSITGGVVSGAIAIGEAIAGFFLMMVLLFFFLKDGDKICDWILRQFRGHHRTHVAESGRRAWGALSGYVRGTAIVALVDAALIGILLAVLGVPLLVPLVVLTFFGAFFPLIGATIAGIVAALVALVTEGVTDALIVGAGILVIQQIEGDVLQPLVLGRSVRLHPIVILLSLTAGAILAGIAGAFLAVPVTAVVVAVGSYLRGLNRDENEAVAYQTTERGA